MTALPRACAAALTAISAVAFPCWAQSSVSVFGILDAAARSVSNEGKGSIRSLVSGAGNTSRLGFRGSEDLGGGLSAGFHLEHGIAVDTGAQANSTLFWDRRATLSLVSKSLGELRAGRDFVPTYTAWVRYDPFAYVGVAASSILLGSSPTGPASGLGSPPNLRAGNAVQYILPSGLAGFDGALMVTAGEGGKATDGQHKHRAGRVGYTRGGFSASAALAQTENDLTAGNKFKDTTFGARYDFGFARFSLARREFKFKDARQTSWLASGTVPVGGHELKWMFMRADVDGKVGTTDVGANDARHVGLGYVHHLSKRTALYATAARINNDGKANFAISGGPTLVAGSTSTGYEAGMRHSF
jgi:predicted porin